MGHWQCLDMELDNRGGLTDFHHCDPLKTSSVPLPNPGINTPPTPGPQRMCTTTSRPENPGQIPARRVFKKRFLLEE